MANAVYVDIPASCTMLFHRVRDSDICLACMVMVNVDMGITSLSLLLLSNACHVYHIHAILGCSDC